MRHGCILTSAALMFCTYREYLVQGAGCAVANGRYIFKSAGQDGSPSYALAVPEGTPDAERPPDLTLFRCTMRNKCKYWFISVADPASPGTDKVRAV